VDISDRRKPLTASRVLFLTAGLAGLLAACVLLATSFGAAEVTLLDALAGGSGFDEIDRRILLDLRLPRVLLAALLGGALSAAGVVFQALLRNPLADPYVLGVSGGASIGGVLALLLGLGGAGGLLAETLRPLSEAPSLLGGGLRLLVGIGHASLAFVGALGALGLILRVATVGGRLTVYTVLLTGAIFNAFSAALIYFIQSIASLERLQAIVFYLMGQIPSYGYPVLCALGLAILGVVVALFASARQYNALSLGEEAAMQVGVDVERLKRRTLVLGSLLTALAVAVAGMIGFVGLVVPHILRILLGPDHRLLLPASLFGGAAFLVLADFAARVAVAPGELPVGVVTALIGGPFFLSLLRRSRGRHGFL
jgi:iron complex transport system permease protein